MPSVLRLRILYGVSGPLSYASVLDIGRLWERLLSRACIGLAFSQGFNPHPRMQFAAALAVGYTSDYEVLDIWVTDIHEPDQVLERLRSQSPVGLAILGVEDIPLNAPSPQANLSEVTFRITLESPSPREVVETEIRKFLDSQSYVYSRTRKDVTRPFDLRPLILELKYVGFVHDQHILNLRLMFKAAGSVRPEEVLNALDIPITSKHIHRTHLAWKESEG